MSLTLYWNLISQPARSAKVLINMGALEAESISMDLLKGQTHTPEYLSKNPFGMVPFITHGDYFLGESNAILVYLCQAFPEKLGKYYGDSPKKRGIVNQYLSWYQNGFRAGLFRTIQHKVAEKAKRGIKIYKYQLQGAQREIKENLELLESILSKNQTPFLTGEQVTIADLQLFHEITDLLVYEIPFNNYGAITAWFNSMLTVKEVRQIHEQFVKVVPVLTNVLKNITADDQ